MALNKTKKRIVRILTGFIPVSKWRKQARNYLNFNFVRTEEQREQVRKGQELAEMVETLIKPGTVCIDCGANVGQETVPWAKLGAEIHAFEPHPGCFELLTENARGLDNVHLYQKGVWHKNDVLKLYLPKEKKGAKETRVSSVLKAKQNVDESNYVEVEIVNIFEFIEGLGKRVNVLKIDIEGAEVEIIREMIDRKFYAHVDTIVIETHEDIPAIRESILALRDEVKEKGISNMYLDWR